MEDSLPITLTTQGLFEANDKSSTFLISKLEAWLNFKALSANWYGDESLVVNMGFTLMPEAQFMELEVEKDWLSINLPTLTAVYQHDMSKQQFTCLIMLSNKELDAAMQDGSKVEAMFQAKLAAAANVLAAYYELAAI